MSLKGRIGRLGVLEARGQAARTQSTDSRAKLRLADRVASMVAAARDDPTAADALCRLRAHLGSLTSGDRLTVGQTAAESCVQHGSSKDRCAYVVSPGEEVSR